LSVLLIVVSGAGALPLAVAHSAAAQSGLETIVETTAGSVSGVNGPVRIYRGIPYAAPPVGDLRWAPPQPVEPWDGLLVADEFGPACIQPNAAPSEMSEDCLTLNVWTSAPSADAAQPVLVWIHGGAFRTGSGGDSWYDGTALAAEGVVIVTINYRLGNFGFFAHPELSAENPEGFSGNQAVLDWVAALEWVQANIAGFGGDPDNVTVWGESAGATAVGLLAISPKAEGLFARGVANSPYGSLRPTTHLTEARYGREASENVGAGLGDLAALRALSAEEVNELRRSDGRQIIDGVVIPEDPAAMLLEERMHDIDLMVGTNADEGATFAPRVADAAEAEAAFIDELGDAGAELMSLYGVTDETAQDATRAMSGDVLFRMNARELARAAAAGGGGAYLYSFERVSGVGERRGGGTFHAADIPYWFRNLPNAAYVADVQPGDFTDIDAEISQAMSGHLLSFARNGDPNGEGLPKWRPFRLGDERHIEYRADGIEAGVNLRWLELDAVRAINLEWLETSGSD
jgi:para-nitrobenzyl esterase